MFYLFYLYPLVFKTTQFYQLKDLLFSVDWILLYERTFGQWKAVGALYCALEGKRIPLTKSKTQNKGRKLNGRKVFKVNELIIHLARCSGLQA